MLDQEPGRPSGHYGDHPEPRRQSLEQVGYAGQGPGRGRVGDDGGQGAVEIGDQRGSSRVDPEWRQQRRGSRGQSGVSRPAGNGRVAQVPAAVVVAVVAPARSGATTTSTSAVPMVLTGAAVVYGSTAEGVRWSVAATAVAATFCPAT